MSWDRLARWYRALEYAAYGRALERCRNYFIATVRDAGVVLVAGDGDGRFLDRFAAAAPQASIDYLDASCAMLRLAQSRIERSGQNGGRMRFRREDAITAQLAPAQYELIATHFFLDCFRPEQARELVAKLGAAAQPRARWIVSEFHRPPRGVWRIAGSAIIAAMYGFFRMATGLTAKQVPDYASYLEAAGFTVADRKTWFGGLIVAELWKREKAQA